MLDIRCFASSSKGNCYVVDDGQTKIMLDCGLSYRKIQEHLNFQVCRISACLVTHEHLDHSASVKDLVAKGIDCYMSAGTQLALSLAGHRVHTVAAKERFDVGTWTVIAFDVEHDCMEPLGFLLLSKATGEKLLYLTDSYYCRYKFPGLTHIIIEANYARDILQANVDAGRIPSALKNRLLHSHMSLENCKEFLKANVLSSVQQIVLCHLSDGNSCAARFKREVQELTGKHVIIAGG